MKKLFAIAAAAALMLSLSACGNSSSGGKDQSGESSVAQTSQSAAPTTEGTTAFDAEAKKAELQEQIVGNWTFYNWMLKTTSNHLVFNADGTGSYQGGVVEDGKYEFDYTFTYEISVNASGDAYNPSTDNSITIRYNEIDDSETRRLTFYDDGKLNLVNAEHQIIQFDEYTREENVPQQ